MFTTCNECGTVFRIGPAELRVAEGQVRCGHCSATFNALATLTDEAPPTTILPQLTTPPHIERQSEPAVETMAAMAFESEPEPEPEPDISALDAVIGDQMLEFNVPEDDWSEFFVEAPEPQPLPAIGTELASEADPIDRLELELELEEVDETPVYSIEADDEMADEAQEAQEPHIAPAAAAQDEAAPPIAPILIGRPFEWQPDFEPPAPKARRRGWFGLGAVILALALVLQLIHYRRDQLAAQPALHQPLTRIYAALNLSLLPDWKLDAYEVRSSEAVAGATTRGALDVLARIAVVGSAPTGLPLVRVTLHDRFAKSLGSRVFAPDEYLDGVPPPAGLLAPGYLIPVRVSLRDPGTEAFGYEVDVCVLYRRRGMVCQQEQDRKMPFTR